jgi:SAM-dependent methyltransferase
MKEKQIILSAEARNVLISSDLSIFSDCCVLALPGVQLPRNIYVEIKTALEAIDGKWKSSALAKGFRFPRSAEDTIRKVIMSGVVPNRRQTFQEFFTPPLLAAEMASIVLHHRNVSADAERSEVHSVLEPSAGKGAIVDALTDGAEKLGMSLDITAVEIQDSNAFSIRGKDMSEQRVSVLHRDFLDWAPNIRFDAVCMNPPFNGRTWMMHIRHAMTFLKPGGILVAVVPAIAAESVLEDELGEICLLEPVNAKFEHTNIKVQLLTVIKGAKSRTEIMVDNGYSARVDARLRRTEKKHTLDDVVASEFNKCHRKSKRLFPSAKLKNPDFYLKQVRRGVREVTKMLDELEAELHKD